MREDLERARTGDPDAFGRLAAGKVERLLVVARLILGDRDLADDAVQETLVRYWRYLPTLRDADRFEAWLDRILMRAIADEFKRRPTREVSIEAVQVEPCQRRRARSAPGADHRIWPEEGASEEREAEGHDRDRSKVDAHGREHEQDHENH